MYGTSITIVGNVVDDVALRLTDSGVARLSFRVASTQRRKESVTGIWTDGNKLFIKVTCWRDFAENVAVSIKKGDALLVTGRIYSRQYLKDENNHVSYEIDADAIGPNLARGTSDFTRRKRGFSGSVEVDADGMPLLESDDRYEIIEEGPGRFAEPDMHSAPAFVSVG
jgi:single-strand DNA-binding protein